MYETIRLWTAVSCGLAAVSMGWIANSFGFQWNLVLLSAMMAVSDAWGDGVWIARRQ